MSEHDLNEEALQAAISAYLENISKQEQARCDFCGQTDGHSQRCAVTKWGYNPKPPYN